MVIDVITAMSYFGLGLIAGMSGVLVNLAEKYLCMHKNKNDTSYTNIEKIYKLHKKYDSTLPLPVPIIIDNPVYLKKYHDTMIKFYDYMILEENGVNIFDM
jgi:hypothetical protein